MKEEDKKDLLQVLEERFNAHMHRHKDLSFKGILKKLDDELLLKSIYQMQITGGQPDLLVLSGKQYYVDMVNESPKVRSSVCYDKEARQSRKLYPPKTSAMEMAELMGISLLDETMYLEIQEIEDLDIKTSTWLDTPQEIRALGGGLFGDKRYQRTFIYHNGADSYYKTRGFRGYVKI